MPPSDRVIPPRINNAPVKETLTAKFKPSNTENKQRLTLGDGDVAWRQGAFWIVKRKNGDEDYSRRPPEGAKVETGTPRETFFTRGPKPPQELEHEMGVTRAEVDLTRNPRIDFEATNKPRRAKEAMPREVRRQLGMR